MRMPVIASPTGDEFKAVLGSNNVARPNLDPVIECAACGSIISDRFYLLAVDRKWHEKCLQCYHCKKPLQDQEKCYYREGQIYCREDYFRIFIRRCNRCGQGIYLKDLFRRALNNVYHVQCFTCVICNKMLSTGDRYGILNNLVYCQDHLEMYSSGHPLSGLGPLGGGVSHFGDCFLSSENAIHPVNDQFSSPNDPITGVPAYGAMYGSPGSGVINSSSLSHAGCGPAASVSAGVVAPGTAVTGTGVRKGRPRKRKTVVNGADAQSGCSMHDANNDGTPGPNSQTLSGSVTCGVDMMSGSIQDSSGVSSNGGQNISCHGLNGQGGQRSKRVRTSFKHHQLRAMKNYFSYNQNPDAKDLKNLSHKTGLSKRVLQVWFQNARAKWRRNNNKNHEQVTGDGQPLSQKSLGGNSIVGNAESPSTGIGSPGGSSTRPLSTPSPSIATMMHEQNEMVPSNASNGSSLDQFPQISSSSCTMVRRSSSPPPSQISHTHLSHSHHSHTHQSGIHQTNGDSIIPALTSFQAFI